MKDRRKKERKDISKRKESHRGLTTRFQQLPGLQCVCVCLHVSLVWLRDLPVSGQSVRQNMATDRHTQTDGLCIYR